METSSSSSTMVLRATISASIAQCILTGRYAQAQFLCNSTDRSASNVLADSRQRLRTLLGFSPPQF
jgi:hypothetical protein